MTRSARSPLVTRCLLLLWLGCLALGADRAAAADTLPVTAGATKIAKYTGGKVTVSFVLGDLANPLSPKTSVPVSVVSLDAAWLTPSTPEVIVKTSGKGVGKGKAVFILDRNSSALERGASVNIGGVDCPLRQAGAPCTVALQVSKAASSSSGGEGTFEVVAPLDCAWGATADPTAGWLTVQDGANRSGPGTVSYSVAPNEVTKARKGKILVATRLAPTKPKTFTAAQDRGVPLFHADVMAGVWDSVLTLSDKVTVETTLLTFAADGTGSIHVPPGENNDFAPDDTNPMAWSIDDKGQLVVVESSDDSDNQWTWTYARVSGDKVSATVYSHATNDPDEEPGATYRFPSGTLVRGADGGAPRFSADAMPGTWDSVLTLSDGKTVQRTTVTFAADGTGTIHFPPSEDNEFDPNDTNPIVWWMNASGQLGFVESSTDGQNHWTWTYTRGSADNVSATVYSHKTNDSDGDPGKTYRFPSGTFLKE